MYRDLNAVNAHLSHLFVANTKLALISPVFHESINFA